LKAKIKEDAEAQFATQADQKLGDVTEFLIESTKFDLPTEFLKNGYKL
jgi:trigger factor